MDGNKIETKSYVIENGNHIWDGRYDRIGSVKFNYDFSNTKNIQIVSDVDLIIGSYGLGNTIVDYSPTILELR